MHKATFISLLIQNQITRYLQIIVWCVCSLTSPSLFSESSKSKSDLLNSPSIHGLVSRGFRFQSSRFNRMQTYANHWNFEHHSHSGWWFQTWFLCSISYMGCHPSHWCFSYFSRWLYKTTFSSIWWWTFYNIPMKFMVFQPPSPWISPPRIDGDFSMTSHKINHMARLEATDKAMARTARIVITDYYWL